MKTLHSRGAGARWLIAFALAVALTTPALAEVIWQSDFESKDLGGWKARGTSEKLEVVSDAHGGVGSLAVRQRTTTWQGPIRALDPAFQLGATYRISAWLKYPQGPATRTLNLSAELSFKDPAAAHQYKNLASVTVNRGEWGKIEVDYTVPADNTLASVDLYFETPYKADSQVTPDDVVDFQVDDVVVDRLGESQKLSVQEDIPRLRDVFAGELIVGTAVSPEQLLPSDPHFRLLAKHFGAIVAGNEMKPEALQPREGVFSFGVADRLVAYADLTGSRLRGHTLLWHNQTPAWFFTDPKDPNKPATKELLLQRLKTHVTTVVSHFKGQVYAWDVVNEVLSDGKGDAQGLRTGSENSQWYAIAGPEYLDVAFRAARATDPDALLTINDYNLESSPAKREAMYQLVKAMKARGVPVDVVGLQGHISLYGPSVEDFRTAIRRYASLGVKVQVTELDMSIYSGGAEGKKEPTKEILDRQARRYAELFQMFREEATAGRLDMVMFWGPSDDSTWLDNFPVPGRPDAPLLFDRKLQAKPAFWAIVDPTMVPASTLPVAKRTQAAKGTPLVDGTVDAVWTRAKAIPTEVVTQGDRAATGSFRVLWDETYLYVLAEVKDSTLDDTSPNVYEQDSVEVFVDQNNHKTEGYETDDGQFRVNFKNLVSFNGNPGAQSRFKSAAKPIAGGYLVEMAIPFTELTPRVGTVIGFDAQVNDGTAGKRTGIRNFNDSSNSGWQSTLGYGLLVLEQ